MEMKQTPSYSTLDLYISAFLMTCGFPPTLEVRNGKVIFFFPGTGELYQSMMKFNSNVEMPILDYVVAVKTLRSQMLSLRERKQY